MQYDRQAGNAHALHVLDSAWNDGLRSLYLFGLAVAMIMIFIEMYERYIELNDYVGQLGIKVFFTIP